MSHDLALAQNHAWSLARTLMVPVILFKVEDEYGSGGVIVLRVHKSFSVDCGLKFVVISRPAPGSVQVFDRAGEGAELVYLAANRQDAETWLQSHRYPNAVLEDVSADTAAADAVEGRAA